MTCSGRWSGSPRGVAWAFVGPSAGHPERDIEVAAFAQQSDQLPGDGVCYMDRSAGWSPAPARSVGIARRCAPGQYRTAHAGQHMHTDTIARHYDQRRNTERRHQPNAYPPATGLGGQHDHQPHGRPGRSASGMALIHPRGSTAPAVGRCPELVRVRNRRASVIRARAWILGRGGRGHGPKIDGLAQYCRRRIHQKQMPVSGPAKPGKFRTRSTAVASSDWPPP
jgi:hypothetical protein